MWNVPMFFPCTSSLFGFHISTVTNQETLVAWTIFFLKPQLSLVNELMGVFNVWGSQDSEY